MFEPKIVIVAVIMVAAIFTGCATILSGKNRAINVSAQNGEEVKIQAQTKDGVINLKTPSILNVTAANKDIIITVTDPCYKKTQTIVSKKIDGTFWVNVLSGGVCGSTTDSASGAMWTYDPNVIVPTSKKARCK